MCFNKSLIKCEKFVSCLMQHSKKYWKWPETYVLILHSYWTRNFKILLFLLYGVISTLYNSKMLLSLHYFITPQFQTFTNLLIGIFWVSNPTFFLFAFCFFEIFEKLILCYNVICFLYLCHKNTPSSTHTHIHTHTHLKNITPSFISFCQAPS